MFALVPRHPHQGTVITERGAKLLLGQTQDRQFINSTAPEFGPDLSEFLPLTEALWLANYTSSQIMLHCHWGSIPQSVSLFKHLHVLLIILYRSSTHDMYIKSL